MKYFVFLFIFGLSFTAFSANTVSEVRLEVLDTLKQAETEKELKAGDSYENVIAFECYYTVEWLYIDSPFIKKLDALA